MNIHSPWLWTYTVHDYEHTQSVIMNIQNPWLWTYKIRDYEHTQSVIMNIHNPWLWTYTICDYEYTQSVPLSPISHILHPFLYSSHYRLKTYHFFFYIFTVEPPYNLTGGYQWIILPPLTRLHGVTSQKLIIWMLTAAEPWSLMQNKYIQNHINRSLEAPRSIMASYTLCHPVVTEGRYLWSERCEGHSCNS
jgi:hypothetical protein